VEELAEVVVAGVQMARVEASHYCSAMGIEGPKKATRGGG
jgi:hypothetical protein